MPSVTLRNATDTMSDSVNPSRTFADRKNLQVKQADKFVYVYFNRAAPLGSVITAATLRMYHSGDWGGSSRTLTTKRVSASWKASKLNDNNKPGVVANPNAATVDGGGADGTLVSWNVATLLQNVSDGARWYGFRIESNEAVLRTLYSSEGLSQYKPTLDVSWVEYPDQPSTLSPSGGRSVSIAKPVLRFDYTDEIGDTALANLQVQINPTNSFTAPAFDTGTWPATEPTLDLNTTAYAGLAAAATCYWRVRAQNAAGLWSAWSDPTSFRRDNKGTATITNPAATTGPVETNRMLDPSVESGVTGNDNTNNSSLYPYSYDTAVYYTGTRSAKTTRTTTTPATTIGSVFLSPANNTTAATRILVTPGEVISALGRIRMDTAGRGQIQLSFRKSDGTLISTSSGPQTTYPTPNTWMLVKIENIVVPALSAWVSVMMAAYTPSAAINTVGGEQAWYDACKVVSGPTVISDESFDGNTPPHDGYEYAWTGTPNQSTSTKSMPVVGEPTPPFIWTFAGATQRAWQVRILDALNPATVYADSGKRLGTETSWTPPNGSLSIAGPYLEQLRIWDTVDRESTPGDPPYVLTTRVFSISDDASVTAVTGLTAGSVLVYRPTVALTWTRATAPDKYVIVRDNKVIDDAVLPGDALVGGTSYQYLDDLAQPWRPHIWKVQPVVNNKQASSSSVSATPTQYGIWLIDSQRKLYVWLAGDDDGQFALGEEATVVAPLNATQIQRRIQSQRGYEGTIGGVLVDQYGRSWVDYESDLLKMRDQPARSVALAMGDMSIKAILGNVSTWPTKYQPITRRVQFDFWEQK